MTKYGMAVDMRRCAACNRCSMACIVEHNLPDGVLWTHAVAEGGDYDRTPGGTYPSDLSMKFYTISCQHCDMPLCYASCPTGAIDKRDDGIVTTDMEACIGCEACVPACPYSARTFISGEPTYQLDFAVGSGEVHLANTAVKCTFCTERVDADQQPRCVEVCYAHARVFGDLDDPDSEISKLIAERDYELLLADQGTGPNIYYLK